MASFRLSVPIVSELAEASQLIDPLPRDGQVYYVPPRKVKKIDETSLVEVKLLGNGQYTYRYFYWDGPSEVSLRGLRDFIRNENWTIYANNIEEALAKYEQED